MNPIVEINATIMSTLVELLKQGGPIALWGLGLWLFFSIIRFVVVSLTVYLVVKIVCQTISTNYKISKEISGQRIQLVSEKVSERLETALKSFSEKAGVLLEDLEKLVKNLQKSLNKKSD